MPSIDLLEEHEAVSIQADDVGCCCTRVDTHEEICNDEDKNWASNRVGKFRKGGMRLSGKIHQAYKKGAKDNSKEKNHIVSFNLKGWQSTPQLPAKFLQYGGKPRLFPEVIKRKRLY